MAFDEVARALESSLQWNLETARLGARAGFRCEYCGKDLLASVDAYDSWQVDHIVPSSKKGDDHFDNLALACKTCNFMKRNRTPAGATRGERIADAARHIQLARAEKLREIADVRSVVVKNGLG